jgi:CheY-like chemotaxis protein
MVEQESSTRRRALVMIVDDDHDFQDCLGALLEDSGFDVVRAWDGAEALRLFRFTLPHVVILDGMMPGLNGPSTLEAMRADPYTANLPVIFSSASTCDHARGASAVMKKPFRLEEMISLIHRLARLEDMVDARQRPRGSEAEPRPA